MLDGNLEFWGKHSSHMSGSTLQMNTVYSTTQFQSEAQGAKVNGSQED